MTASPGNQDAAGDESARTREMAAMYDAWLVLTGQVAASAGSLRVVLRTGSMYPALPRGCTLLIDPARPVRFAPGDVVVMDRGGRLVAHRVLLRTRWRGRPWLLEMGDANRRGAWRPAGQVVGRVVGAENTDGSPLRPPSSRPRAWRLLARHIRGVWLPAPPDDEPARPQEG